MSTMSNTTCSVLVLLMNPKVTDMVILPNATICLPPKPQIVALGKITMSVTFGFINNTRTEQVVFDIVDMEYPYNAIIGRGTLNAFEAILHPAYLCMKALRVPRPIIAL